MPIKRVLLPLFLLLFATLFATTALSQSNVRLLEGAAPPAASPAGAAGPRLVGTVKSAVPLEEGQANRGSSAAYDNVAAGPGGYVAFPAATGVLGFDDYDSAEDANFDSTEMQFVGGVTVGGGEIQIDFRTLDDTTSLALIDVTFAMAGNFIYTITIPSTNLPDTGIVRVTAINGAEGQWFLSDGIPFVGTEDGSIGTFTDGTFAHNFALGAPLVPVELMGFSIE